jgi:outer membrane protein TolC
LRQAQAQVEAAEVAFRGGRGSQADVFASRAALANLQDKLRQTQRQAQAADVMLARWVGAEAARRPLTGDVDWKNSELATSLTEHLKDHPGLALLAAQVDAAQAELKLAQANTRPDITVEAAYQQRGSAYSNMVSVGVSIPLQIDQFNRQDREVAAKAAMLREAQARYDDALAAEEAMLRTLVNDWQSGKERLTRLSGDLLSAAKNRTESALAAYRSGKGDLSAVLSARRDEIDASLQLLTLQMDTARLWAQLNFLIPSSGAGAPMEHS